MLKQILTVLLLLSALMVMGQPRLLIHRTDGQIDSVFLSKISKLTFKNDTTYSGTLTYNGFTYTTVIIGNQEWTVENLRTTKYNDGTDITKITDNNAWINNPGGAYCAYENNESNVDTYGYLYNWYAVDTWKLAPDTGGWRVPTDADWTALTEFLGGESVAGARLKATTGWNEHGNGSNDFGFSALPGGCRFYDYGNFRHLGYDGYWWSSTFFPAYHTDYAWYRSTYFNYSYVYRSGSYKWFGFSVRLVRDL